MRTSSGCTRSAEERSQPGDGVPAASCRSTASSILMWPGGHQGDGVADLPRRIRQCLYWLVHRGCPTRTRANREPGTSSVRPVVVLLQPGRGLRPVAGHLRRTPPARPVRPAAGARSRSDRPPTTPRNRGRGEPPALEPPQPPRHDARACASPSTSGSLISGSNLCTLRRGASKPSSRSAALAGEPRRARARRARMSPRRAEHQQAHQPSAFAHPAQAEPEQTDAPTTSRPSRTRARRVHQVVARPPLRAEVGPEVRDPVGGAAQRLDERGRARS